MDRAESHEEYVEDELRAIGNLLEVTIVLLVLIFLALLIGLLWTTGKIKL